MLVYKLRSDKINSSDENFVILLRNELLGEDECDHENVTWWLSDLPYCDESKTFLSLQHKDFVGIMTLDEYRELNNRLCDTEDELKKFNSYIDMAIAHYRVKEC